MRRNGWIVQTVDYTDKSEINSSTLLSCFECGYEWSYRVKNRRVHRCYNCGNIFVTAVPRGLVPRSIAGKNRFQQTPVFDYRKSGPCVYLLETSIGTIYTDETVNIMQRLNQHVHGSGANHTKKLGVKKFLAHKYFRSKGEAKRIEGLIQDNLFPEEKLVLARYWNSVRTGKPFPPTIWKAIQEGYAIKRKTGKNRNSFNRNRNPRY